MSIKLRNANVLPLQEFETITILGLEIPVKDRLSFGAQVEVMDLQGKYASGDIGEFEYLIRLFCTFTRILPKPQRVTYEWLSQQQLDADEVAELTTGTLALLNALTGGEAGESKNADAPKATRAKKKTT